MLVDLLTRRLGSKKTTDTLTNCLNNAIQQKFQTVHDTKEFLQFLKSKQFDIQPMVDDINTIIQKNSPNYQEQIEQVYDEYLGDESYQLRFEYTVNKILYYSLNFYAPEQVDTLRESLDMSNTDFDYLDEMFQRYLGRTFTYLQNRYDHSINKRTIQRKFQEWNIPKFTIYRPTYTQRSNTQEICPNCRSARLNRSNGIVTCVDCGVENINYQESRPSFTQSINWSGGTLIEGDEGLQRVQEQIEGSVNKRLRNDWSILSLITRELGYPEGLSTSVQGFWTNVVFPYLKSHNMRPHRNKRNGLYIYAIYLIGKERGRDESVKYIQEIAEESNVESNMSETVQFYKQLFDTVPDNPLRETFINRGMGRNVVKQYLLERGVPEDMVPEIILDPGMNKKTKMDIIYTKLKPMKRELKNYGINVTQKWIKETFLNYRQ